uniref:Xaa-Pro aminopeptidase n=1 Tax=Firmicutes bacterium enrichment culture clone fosmid MGS-M1 TaxID=1549348 RepID=A0A0B5KNC8_9FIRM|nr:xaa-pro aminopeptidase [Firmicutes bacterium enrichment culture clone fosmid MGS-M1]
MNIYEQRRKKYYEEIDGDSVTLLFSGEVKHKTNDQFFPFCVNRNFYYLTGIDEPNVILMMIKKSKEETQTKLFIRETTEFVRQWLGAYISKEDASTLSNIAESDIHFESNFKDMVKGMMQYGRSRLITTPSKLYLDLYQPSLTLKPIGEETFEEIINTYKQLKIKDANKYLSFLRMFKDEAEVEIIKTAINRTKQGLNAILKELKHSENEQDLASLFLRETTMQGSKDLAFSTIAASGENATILHYEQNNKPIQKDGVILFDLGASAGNYSSDISRTYPASGTFTKRQKELYEIVLDVNKKAIEYSKVGTTWVQLNKFAKDLLAKHCQKIGLINDESEISKYYYHSIGHFMGLDTHDVGQYELPFKEGMIITIEPGLYIKEEGIGIRIEDDILITKEGPVNLSKDIIKEVEDIENALK